MAINLTDLDPASRAMLAYEQVTFPDGTVHYLGHLISEQDRETGEYTKIAAFSHTRDLRIARGEVRPPADAWMNLLTGEPLHGGG